MPTVFTFTITRPYHTTDKAYVRVLAETEEQATAKLKALSQEELNAGADEWLEDERNGQAGRIEIVDGVDEEEEDYTEQKARLDYPLVIVAEGAGASPAELPPEQGGEIEYGSDQWLVMMAEQAQRLAVEGRIHGALYTLDSALAVLRERAGGTQEEQA